MSIYLSRFKTFSGNAVYETLECNMIRPEIIYIQNNLQLLLIMIIKTKTITFSRFIKLFTPVYSNLFD